MKIVVCKNCGAKYQLDDSEDISAFECSICTGSLEKLEDNINGASQNIDSNGNFKSDSVIVCCRNCGLKFKLDKNENIDDFECVSCGGSLIYLDDDLNKIYSMDSSEDNYNHEVEIIDDGVSYKEYNSNYGTDSKFDEIVVDHGVEPVDEIVVDHGVEPVKNTFTKNKFNVQERNIESNSLISDNSEFVPNNFYKKIRQPKTLHRKPLSGKDLNKLNESKNSVVFDSFEDYQKYQVYIFKTYDSFKTSLKKEYLDELDNLMFSNRSQTHLIKRNNSSVHPKLENNQMTYKKLVKSREDPATKKLYWSSIILGIVLMSLGFILFLLTKQLITLIILVLGFILLVFGVYKKFSVNETEFRSKIIREKLEELPEDFYLFYFTKPPYARDALNHVIVGPTGIYTILTHKYSPKNDKQKFESENDALLSGAPDIKNYMDKKNILELKDGYSDNQTRFQFGNEEIEFDNNNKIKHKSLTLNEDLAIFLDQNGFRGVYIEPLIGFVNEDVAIINVVLTNEDLFLEELLSKISRGPRRLDSIDVIKISKLLSKYSINCAVEN